MPKIKGKFTAFASDDLSQRCYDYCVDAAPALISAADAELQRALDTASRLRLDFNRWRIATHVNRPTRMPIIPAKGTPDYWSHVIAANDFGLPVNRATTIHNILCEAHAKYSACGLEKVAQQVADVMDELVEEYHLRHFCPEKLNTRPALMELEDK